MTVKEISGVLRQSQTVLRLKEGWSRSVPQDVVEALGLEEEKETSIRDPLQKYSSSRGVRFSAIKARWRLDQGSMKTVSRRC